MHGPTTLDDDPPTPAPRALSSGFRTARVRADRSLPFDWRHLTTLDVKDVEAIVARVPDQSKAMPFELEAALLPRSMLVTGQEARQLIALGLGLVVVSKGHASWRQPPWAHQA